ncbi:hypothetical protein [Hyphomicrobium sp. CS1BSMeth3]|uniref:hypothetical protein n=1 Tax=Hyphomicrobium sp. CS1BSMeth3 TaxID=1892844 RepID=UPI0009315F29|nr:hypothetical protein [Hyphomicrobium sp. CS1BSMeth3]
MINRCSSALAIMFPVTALVTAAPVNALNDPLRTIQNDAFIKACAKSPLIHPRDCACAEKLLAERFTPARITLATSVLKALTAEQSTPPAADAKPFCLLILEQEGANTIPYFTALINTLKDARTACQPSP